MPTANRLSPSAMIKYGDRFNMIIDCPFFIFLVNLELPSIICSGYTKKAIGKITSL